MDVVGLVGVMDGGIQAAVLSLLGKRERIGKGKSGNLV